MWIACTDCGYERRCTQMETPQGDRDLCTDCIAERRRKGERILATSRDRSKDPVR
jgi:hypothetical protein